MKKSIFKASFEESLNLLDDALLQYIKKDYNEKLGKGLNNGKPSIGFRIKSILYSVFFVFGCNFLCALFASSLDVADPKDLTLPVHKPSLLTPELFLICCFIWLLLVLIGKFVRKSFIRPYRYRFHMETFLFWFCLEFNLLAITVALPTLTSVGIWFIYILLFIIALIFLRMEKRSLSTCFFGEETRETLVDRIAGLIATYGSGVSARACCNHQNNLIAHGHRHLAKNDFVRYVLDMDNHRYWILGNGYLHGVALLFRRFL